jgi:hypothetical protein
MHYFDSCLVLSHLSLSILIIAIIGVRFPLSLSVHPFTVHSFTHDIFLPLSFVVSQSLSLTASRFDYLSPLSRFSSRFHSCMVWI